MQTRLASLALLCLLAACASPELSTSEKQLSANSAIIGGATDKGDPAVVELIQAVGDNEFSCTATFISQNVLITAAHCAVGEDDPKNIPAGATFKINRAYADSVAKDGDFIDVPVANVHPHPDYDGEAAHDIAIVVLDVPVTDITPVAIRRTAIDKTLVGKAVRLVGYGSSTRNDTGAGTKRVVNTTLRALKGDLLMIGNTGKQACEGDSGGPAFMTIDGVETLIGTDDVAATSQDCAGGDLYQRPDLHLDFIDQYLNAPAPIEDTGVVDDTTDPSTSDPFGDEAQVADATPPADEEEPPADEDDFCVAFPDDPSCTFEEG